MSLGGKRAEVLESSFSPLRRRPSMRALAPAVGARPPQTSAQRREQAKQAAFIWEGSVDLFTNVTVSQESAGMHLVHDWMWVFLARHNIF